MQANLVNFIRVLRSHEMRVSPAETLDAFAVTAALGYADRDLLRDGLAMTLAKTAEEESIFLQCFERYFGHVPPDLSRTALPPAADRVMEAPDLEDDSATDPASTLRLAARDDAALRALLAKPVMRDLVTNDRTELSLAINRAAQSVGLRQIEVFTQKGQFTRRMLDALGEEHLRRAIIELERRDSPVLPLVQRYRDILREQVRDRVEREYLLQAAGKTRQFMDAILSQTRLNAIEHRYLHRVHDLVRKMARKLAARHSRRRRRVQRGQLDMARTLRGAMAHDGVLFNTCWRGVRRNRPQILALCDVSGSVAAYAKFLLLFLYSLQDVLPKVRSFAFSSHLGEVSRLFAENPVEKAIELAHRQYGGATDYGASLRDFATLAMRDIDRDTSVIILGDARNNRGDPRLDLLRDIHRRARRVIWLNPESRRAWGTGDSDMLRYQSACHFSAECNNLKQLERIVDQLLKSSR